jgi:hypothetical protein
MRINFLSIFTPILDIPTSIISHLNVCILRLFLKRIWGNTKCLSAGKIFKGTKENTVWRIYQCLKMWERKGQGKLSKLL